MVFYSIFEIMLKNSTPLLQVHLAVFLFGFAGLFVKWLPIDAMILVWGRVLFASLAFGIWFVTHKTNPFLSKISSKPMLIFMGMLLAFHWWSFFEAIRQSTLALGLLSFASFPVFTAVLEPLILRKGFQLKYLFLALLSALGIYIMVPQWDWNSSYFMGVFWGLMSGLSFSFLTIFNRKILLSGQNDSDALVLTFFQNLVALFVLSAWIIQKPLSLQLSEWLILALLGVVFTAFAHLLFVRGLKHTEARKASLIANLEPVYGVLFGILFFGEWPDVKIIAGGALILVASLLTTLQTKNHEEH